MSSAKTTVYTKTYTTAFTISESDYVARASMIVLSGTCTIRGNARLGSVASGDVTLSAGQTWELPSLGPDAPIDGITITPIGGSVGVMMLL